MRTSFRILGPPDLLCDGRRLDTPTHRHLALLVTLLVRANHVTTVDSLIDDLWGTGPPPSAAANLRNHVCRLRRLLPPPDPDLAGERLATYPGGYLLRVGEEELDSLAFQRLTSHGRAALANHDPHEAAKTFKSALSLWRGTAGEGARVGPATSAILDLLERERLATVEDYVAARLDVDDLGMAELAADLRQHLRCNPLRERAWGQLMIALYRSGDPAGALAAFTTARQTLADELGISPGQELVDLHRAILERDPRLLLRRGERVVVSIGDRRPDAHAQLPTDGWRFTGRRAELAWLDGALVAADPGATVRVVSGTAGVGKTALVAHWGHRVAGLFADGVLYADLRGFDVARPAASSEVALGDLLAALGVPEQRIPSGLGARMALYRGLLADRHALIVLDDARDVDQVRPLLPGSPRCTVLVSSRDQLSGLTAVEGAQTLALDLPSESEAFELLAVRLGEERTAAELDAVRQILAACDRLPLAIAVVVARAGSHGGLSLAALAKQLRDTRSPLDVLACGDPDLDVRARLSRSYQYVGSDAARMFRLLGLHPDPGIDVAAAASLAGVSLERARRSLAELSGINLLREHAPGQFTCHELIRAYAAELSERTDSPADCRAAIGRMLRYQLDTAHGCDACRQLG